MRNWQGVAVLFLSGIIGGAAFAGADGLRLRAHCFCKVTLKNHETSHPNDSARLENADDLAKAKLTVPNWRKIQVWDWVASAVLHSKSCRVACRDHFGVDGEPSAEASALMDSLRGLAERDGQPQSWCGGRLSARLQFAAGTNKYRDATKEWIDVGDVRRCADASCTCPLEASYFDGANCFVARPPANTSPFVHDGKLYYSALNGTDCPLPGSRYDGANCHVVTPPAGTRAFVYDGKLYYSPICG